MMTAAHIDITKMLKWLSKRLALMAVLGNWQQIKPAIWSLCAKHL